LLGVFLKQVRLTRRYAAEAKTMTAHLHIVVPPPSDFEIVLRGDNQSEQVKMLWYDLLYVEASDNYVTLVYWAGSELQQRILRSSLRKVEEMLAGHPQAFRCHRTYIVNLDQVLRLSGNAQGLRLHLKGIDTMIPVSRALNNEIRARLNA
jgi:DNA-binding LytR/AlgR family response regulator